MQSDLGFRVGGKILERCINTGQRVQKGGSSCGDSVDLNLALAAQQANVEAARAKYTQTKADEARFAALVASRCSIAPGNTIRPGLHSTAPRRN